MDAHELHRAETVRLAFGLILFAGTLAVAWAVVNVIRFAFGYAKIDDRSNP